MKITLETYKVIDAIHADDSLSEIDKTLYCICALYNYTPEQLDNVNPLKVVKMANRMAKLLNFKISAPAIIGIYRIDYNISNITFGQYIELSYFFQFSNIDKANYIVATCAKGWKHSHSEKMKRLANKPIEKILGALDKIRKGYLALNKEFGSLFGLDEEQHTEVNKDSFFSYFNNRYGWIFSAEAVAAYERISTEQAFNLPARRALNDLVYLKAKSKYEYLLTKK